jgi:cell division protein FtsZ
MPLVDLARELILPKGELAAQESREDIREAIEGADMVFVTIGAGGGTGSGAGHVVAEVAQELGILVVGFATKPFAFEGEKRRKNADIAIENLRSSCRYAYYYSQ